jgi:hypothetical protein
VDYYEGVLKMVGAGGLPLTTTFKRKFKSIFTEDDPAEGAAPTDADAAPGSGDGAVPAAEASAKRGRGGFSVTLCLPSGERPWTCASDSMLPEQQLSLYNSSLLQG